VSLWLFWKMTSIVVGTAGHIDHGKSALVLALTGTDPDRLKEEKARGIPSTPARIGRSTGSTSRSSTSPPRALREEHAAAFGD
jgi:translation initiation factor 2 gamma subunit (eIF-2gamma)